MAKTPHSEMATSHLWHAAFDLAHIKLLRFEQILECGCCLPRIPEHGIRGVSECPVHLAGVLQCAHHTQWTHTHTHTHIKHTCKHADCSRSGSSRGGVSTHAARENIYRRVAMLGPCVYLTTRRRARVRVLTRIRGAPRGGSLPEGRPP